MTLQDKLSFISKPSIPRMTSGEAETIRGFWMEFIEPKLISNGTQESYSSMSRTVLEVIKNICKKNQYTENELRAVFPDCVAKNVESGYSGFKTVFVERNQANEHDYFIKEVIQLKDKVIVISRQWNVSNFKNFKQVVNKHFNIEINEL